MTHNQPLNHAEFRERIAAALVGGLGATEQAEFEAHAAACESCAAELKSAQQDEDRMTALFSTALPSAGMEDRLIQRLRLGAAPSRWRSAVHLHPAVRRAVTGVAAVLVLGGMGHVVSRAIEHPAADRTRMASALHPGQAAPVESPPAAPGLISQWDDRSAAAEYGSSAKEPQAMGLPAIEQTTKAAQGNSAPPASVVYDYDAADPALRPSLSLSIDTKTVAKQLDVDPDAKTFAFKPTELKVEAKNQAGPVAVTDGIVNGGIVDGVQLGQQPSSGTLASAAPAQDVKAGDEQGAAQENAPAPTPPPPATPAPAEPPPLQVAAPTTRKVIRNGKIEFEVDRYDSAFAQVSKLVTEAGGYVGTTDSEKLPNGKVRGTITVRVPPDRLDTLVLQLRGIGDLKSQKLDAQDVTKQYTDLESQLRAARAMEERLMAIIKEGKGQIKDLLAAEKELGVWRTKVEELVGTMRFYDNQVALSTLNITLYERDIKTAATAFETETVEAGIETQDVEKSRAEAIKAIEEAKGRVIQSDMKRYDAGQFGATIVAEVPPDTAGPMLDRIKQIGKLARLDVQRKQTGGGENLATNAPVRVERRDTRLNLSLYNLANVAPRQTTTLNLAADDVEVTYRAILDRVTKAGGRIVTSNLAQNKPEQTSGTISFEIPSTEADAVASDVRANVEVMKLSVTENPDVQNVTTAKRGFNVTVISTASVAPRETMVIKLAADAVPEAREKVLSAAGAGGARVLSSAFNQSESRNVSATIDLEVKRASLPALEKALTDAGQVVSRVSTRSTDTQNTLDTKLRMQLTLLPADQLPPRETTTLSVETRDVDAARVDLQTAAVEAGARVAESNLSRDRDGRSAAKVVVDAPQDKAGVLLQRAKAAGAVRAIEASKNLDVPAGAMARARIEVTFGNAEAIVSPDGGLWTSIRQGLSTSVTGLLWSLRLIIVGVCFVLPWVLVLAVVWRMWKRRGTAAPAT